MERAVVQQVVDDLAGLLRADGADLRLVDADPARDRIEVALEVADATCADCVLPSEALRAVLHDSLREHVAGEFELILNDPRESDPRAQA